jgi:tetratricopeptide (TPR) repeat protein
VISAVLSASWAAAQGGTFNQPSNSQRTAAMPPYKEGVALMQSEQWDKAAEAFTKAIDIDPTFDMAYYALGKTNLSRKRYTEAVVALSKCRDLYQQNAGRLFSNQQEAQRYRRDRIIEIDEVIRSYSSGPQTAQRQETLRQLNEQRRQLQESIQRGTNMSIDASVPAYVSVALGSAYFRSEKFADAEREYKAALAADSKIGEAHNNLAVVYLTTGRIDDAERAVKAAEKVGFKVNPALKEEIQAAKKKTSE